MNIVDFGWVDFFLKNIVIINCPTNSSNQKALIFPHRNDFNFILDLAICSYYPFLNKLNIIS